jgi:hypothetical protein
MGQLEASEIEQFENTSYISFVVNPIIVLIGNRTQKM